MTRCDLLVVGGGPAGATIAALAADRGLDVVLLEKESFPRDKVCGEFVSPEGCAVLARLGVLDGLRARGARPMDGCLLADGRGRHLAAPLPSIGAAGRTALGVSRALFDETLLREAARRGADVREETAVAAPTIEDGRVRGVAAGARRDRSAIESLPASLVVAADGRRSTIQRALHPSLGDPQATGPRSWFGFKAHFADPTGGLGRRIELFVFDGGYAGLGPVEDGRLDLSFLVRVDALHACGNSPQRLLDERLAANPLLAERLGGRPPLSPWRAVGPLRFNVRKPSSHGALFLGDAAGTIDPYSGEGISNALAGAELALPFVVEACARGGLTPEAARAWDAAWRSAFAPVTRRVRLLGQIFRHPRPAALALRLLRLPAGARVLPSLVAATRTGLPS